MRCDREKDSNDCHDRALYPHELASLFFIRIRQGLEIIIHHGLEMN